MKVSVSIVVHNEARFLPECLESVKWADEIIVVDTGSEDDSVSIASRYTDKICHVENDPNININKQKGIDKCTGDWILYLDPDEIIPDKLAGELRTAAEKGEHEAFLIPRKNYFFGKWLRYGGHYPDLQLRFFKRGKAHFPCVDIHERLEVDGTIGKLKQPFIHQTAISREFYREKLEIKAEFTGRKAFEKWGRRSFFPWLKFKVLKPISYFLGYFILRGEFLNGAAGIWAFHFKVLNASLNYKYYISMVEDQKK